MINLWSIATGQFGYRPDKNSKFIRELVDMNLDMPAVRLAVHIYRLQVKIISKYGESNCREILKALSYIQRVYTQTEIYYTAVIGKNFTIFHGIGAVIGAGVVIGDNVMIYQNVTIGSKGWGYEGRPIIGNGVIIYAGSKILGDVTIGDNCTIGANAVVGKSFPDNSIVGGIPAEKIKKNKAGANVNFLKKFLEKSAR